MRQTPYTSYTNSDYVKACRVMTNTGSMGWVFIDQKLIDDLAVSGISIISEKRKESDDLVFIQEITEKLTGVL
jgi:hypothetical protein